MISIPIILLSIIIIIRGKMPLFSGNVFQGKAVRYVGIIMLTISVGSLFVSSKLSLLLIAIVILLIAGCYFFVNGEDGTK
jgi:hypothetical protein